MTLSTLCPLRNRWYIPNDHFEQRFGSHIPEIRYFASVVIFKQNFAYYEPSLRFFLQKHKPFYFSLKSISLMMCNSMVSTFCHWDTTRSQQNFDFMKCVVEFLFAFHGTSVSVTIDHVYFKLNHYFIFFFIYWISSSSQFYLFIWIAGKRSYNYFRNGQCKRSISMNKNAVGLREIIKM